MHYVALIDVAKTLTSIGLMHFQLSRYNESFDSYQQALQIRREIHGTDDHLDIASTLNSIGLVAFKLEMHELAKCCMSHSLRILRKVAGDNSRDVAILMYNIATIYFETGESEDVALMCYKETLRIERQSLGDDHPDVVLTLLHMGQKQQRVSLDEALEYFTEALAIERRRRQQNNVSIAKILNLIGNIHLQEARVDEMMDCYVEASRIFEASNEPGATLMIAGYNFYGMSKAHPSCAAVG